MSNLIIEDIDRLIWWCNFYGLGYIPFSRKRIASYLIRGFSIQHIYNLACDAYCHNHYFK